MVLYIYLKKEVIFKTNKKNVIKEVDVTEFICYSKCNEKKITHDVTIRKNYD